MLTVFEAFAGIGTQRMALKRLGIAHKVVGISEIDNYAIQSYEAIHGETKNFGDITQINPNDLPDFDLFTYSFPCQDLSISGKQQGMIKGQTRSGLLYECEKIIETKRPTYLLLENVKALVGKKFKPSFDEWLTYLERLGYTNYWQVLNAKDFDVPQHRERVFVVSILGNHRPYAFPLPTTLKNSLERCLFPRVASRYFLSHTFWLNQNVAVRHHPLPLDVVHETLGTYVGIGHHPTSKKKEFRGWMNTPYAPCLIATDYKCPKTIAYQQDQIEGYVVRKLTPLECWRLMGISDDDFFKAQAAGLSDTQLYKQAGNSIVVPVLEGIFKELFLNSNSDES